MNNTIFYETFKQKLTDTLYEAFDHFSSIYNRNISLIDNVKKNILPKITDDFSYYNYYRLVKIASKYRFDRLNGITIPRSLYAEFHQFVKKDFPMVSAFADEINKYVGDQSFLLSFYEDIEDWIFEGIDAQIKSIKDSLMEPRLILTTAVKNISEDDEKKFWFMLFAGPVYHGYGEKEWTNYVFEIVNVNVSQTLDLVFRDKDIELKLTSNALTMRISLMSKLYRYLNIIHERNESSSHHHYNM